MNLDIISILRKTMIKSMYFEFFCRNVNIIGFRFSDSEEYLFIKEKNQVSIEKASLDNAIKAELWVELDKEELYNFELKGNQISKLKIYTGQKGQILNPQVEMIIQRIFMPPKNGKYPIEDLLDLVYGGLFNFQEPRVVWRSQKKSLYVLKYKQVYDYSDLYITYGFTNPDLNSSALKLDEGKISRYGYEMMIFAKEDDKELISEFIDWVKYVDDTENHIYQGQYLEYGDGVKLPNSDIAGFIILNPLGLPYTIPVADGYSTLSMFMGITEEELREVKQKGIYEIAEKLKGAGYINYTPQKRNSVI